MSTADLAILGASIRTLAPARPWASAVAIRDGLIVAVGDDAEVREHCGPSTELLAGDELHLTPGLVDAHQHPFVAEATLGADLTRCTDFAAASMPPRRARCRVAAGHRADLTGSAEDPVRTAADDLPDLPVRLTIVDGEVVHRGP